MSTTQVQKIEVVGSTDAIPLKVASPFKKLPGDLSLDGFQAQQHMSDRVVYDKVAVINTDQERVFACYWEIKDKDFLNVTISDFPYDLSDTLCEVSFCAYDSDHPWGIGATVFTSQHRASAETVQCFGVRPNWTRRSTSTPLCEPFGLWGQYVVVIWRDKDLFIVTPPIRLELYWLPWEAQIPPLLSAGVPLQLLRMFVLPGSKNHANSRDEWIKMVVGICHGSNKPYSGTVSTSLRHWLKFDTLFGASSFTGPYGQTFFDVVKWVDAYRNWKLTRYTMKVNCYDQTAILQTVLSLGISYRRIHWEYHQIYGFIEVDTKLVGWGECNNPFFDPRIGKSFDRSRQVVPGDDPKRQPFLNHAYLTLTECPLDLKDYNWYNNEMRTVQSHSVWKRKTVELTSLGMLPKKYVLDACAGPCVGDQIQTEDGDSSLMIIEDLNAAQNSPYTYVRENSTKNPRRWRQIHYTGPGALVLDGDQPENPEYLPSHDAIAEHHAIITGSIGTSRSAANLGGRLEFLEVDFEDWIHAQIVEQNWQDVTDIPVRPVQLESESFVFETRIHYRSRDEILEPIGDGYFVALRVLVCPNAETAAELLACHLATLVHTSRVDSINMFATTLAEVPMVGNSILKAFTCGNIAVDITGDDAELFAGGQGQAVYNIMQRLAEIAVEMQSTPGDCWQDRLQQSCGQT